MKKINTAPTLTMELTPKRIYKIKPKSIAEKSFLDGITNVEITQIGGLSVNHQLNYSWIAIRAAIDTEENMTLTIKNQKLANEFGLNVGDQISGVYYSKHFVNFIIAINVPTGLRISTPGQNFSAPGVIVESKNADDYSSDKYFKYGRAYIELDMLENFTDFNTSQSIFDEINFSKLNPSSLFEIDFDIMVVDDLVKI